MNTEILADLLKPASKSDVAVHVPGGPVVDYLTLGDEVERVAGLLAAAGAERGRPVSIVLPNGLEFVVVFLAVARCGAVAAPLNPAYTAEEFTFYVEDAGSTLAIVPTGGHAARDAAAQMGVTVIEAALDGSTLTLSRHGYALTASRDAEPPSPEDTALFLHTSGTTSRPKGVPLTHTNLMSSLSNIRRTYQLTPDDVSMIVMPLFHVHGLLGAALSTLNSGGTAAVPDRFSASRFWAEQRESGATWYSAVPTIHQIILQRADDDGAPRRSFRFIRSCSAALAPSVLEKLENRFGAPVLDAYGMTEASHQMCSNPLPPAARKMGSVGPGTGVEIAIMDIERPGRMLAPGKTGEVTIKGPNVTHGYSNNPDANAEAFMDGWFRTGDQGVLDERGYLTLTGRIKELINRGGEKISPLEVDAALLQHPAVAEAVCFGVPDEKYGECVQAAVVLNGQCGEDDLIGFCRERLADFKAPDRVYVTGSLPRTATGKIQRRNVAAAFTGGG